MTVQLTEAAADEIKRIIEDQNHEELKYVRVGVVGGGCSGFQYSFDFTEKYDTKEKIGGTLSSVLYTLSQGVQIFRVHNVKEVKQGILVFKKLLLN